MPKALQVPKKEMVQELAKRSSPEAWFPPGISPGPQPLHRPEAGRQAGMEPASGWYRDAGRYFRVPEAQSPLGDPTVEGTFRTSLQPLGGPGRDVWADTRLGGGAEWVGAGSPP